MPQKVSINFVDSHLNANKLTNVEARANQLIQTNERFHGEIKYLNDITNELSKLVSDITKGYDLIHSKFMQLVNELKVRSTRNSENSLTNNSNASDETPQIKSNGHTEIKKDKFQLLAQKFKTPLEHRTRNFFASKDESNKPSESSSNQMGANSKKRSAILANLSNLGDENREDSVIECDEEKQKTVKKKTTKSKKAEVGMTEKKKKKKKKVHTDNEDDNKMETELAEAAGKSSPSASNHLEESEENKKTTTKNHPSKKIKLNKQKNKQDTGANNEEDIEVMDTTLKDEAKLVKQSSKKQKSSDVSETGEANKVKKKKKKISKQVSVLGADESMSKAAATTTPSNNTNIAKKISINSILRLSQKKKSLLPQCTKLNINLAKTPSNNNRLSTMKYLQSTIKKSIIKPVQTRAAQRAAAQATSKTLTTSTAATTSGTQLKATIATANSTTSLNNKPAETNKSIVSNVKSLASKFNAIATPGQQNRTISNLQQTASKIKTTLRNSIDKRKALSKVKDVKKSLTKEKAMAFLQDNIIKKSDEKASNSNQSSTNNPVLMNDSDSDKDGRSSVSSRRSIRMTSDTVANVNNNTDEYIINEMKIKTPTVKLNKMSNSIFTNGFNHVLYSASKFNKLNDPNPRPIPQTISMSSIKGTPSRTFTQTSLTNLQASVQKSAIKPSFAKFLERNTPSKLTQTALDEKRRAELISKDNKEKERLQEMERQKNEKREEIRRRNEEKLKKAAEQKLQKEAEFKQKIENKNTSILANATHNVQPIKKTFTTLSNHLTAQSSTNQQACSNKLQQASNESIVTFKQPVQVPKVQAATQEEISDFKKSILNFKNSNILQPSVVLTNDFSLKAHNLNDHNNYNKYASNYAKPSNNLETTYILNSPSSSSSSATSKANMQQSLLKASFSNYEVTPLQPLKLKNDDNYDVSELQSGDETDDEEEPSKPLPMWAKEPFISDKAKAQSNKMINFTRLFKSASNYEVDLEEIFKIKRKKFTERSSSAIWETPPVWATSGLNGEESFYRVRKGL